MADHTGYFHLRVGNEWPTFELHGLEIKEDGALELTVADPNAGTFVEHSVFRAGPYETEVSEPVWHRLQVFADAVPAGTHVQVFTLTSDGPDPNEAPYDPAADVPFAGPGWEPIPRDQLDGLFSSSPDRYLWIGGLVHSDGQGSPHLRQVRVTYGRDTYLEFLPSIYARDAAHRDFLERLLSLHESVVGGLEETIEALPRLFDPFAAPSGTHPSWLSWLAGWLAFDVSERWTDAQARENLAKAFALYDQRGTVEGLRRYLKLYANVEARIEEPGRHATLWALDETSTLGFTTVLAPGPAEGAVVGTSATLDQSHLAAAGDFGGALFDDVAHRFCVHVYCAELTRPGALDAVRAVLDREKPAHTEYHLCVIEPMMRVGAQARIGIDAVVAQARPAMQTGMVLGLSPLAAESVLCPPTEEP
jgi:phage tail-like protein